MVGTWRGSAAGLLAAALIMTFGIGEAEAQGRGPAAVQVDAVREEPLAQTVPVIGRLVARQSGTIAARIGGAVEVMAVDVGDRVAPGDILVVLAGERLAAERDRAEAVVSQRRAQLDGARAELAKAQQELDRLDTLKTSAAFSQARYDDVQQDVLRLAGAVAEGRAEVNQALAQMTRAELDLEDSRVRAPYAGVVSEKHTDVGAYVTVGSGVVSLINDQDLEIEADVPGNRVGNLESGTVVSVTLDDGSQHSAIVRALVPDENPLTRTRPVRFTPALNGTDGRLAANQSVSLDIPIGRATNVTTVHKDAVLRRGGGAIVFVVEDGTADIRPVQLGDGVGARFVVIAGLQPGDMVVTRGNESLRPGQEVRVPGEGGPGPGRGGPNGRRQGAGPGDGPPQTAQRPGG